MSYKRKKYINPITKIIEIELSNTFISVSPNDQKNLFNGSTAETDNNPEEEDAGTAHSKPHSGNMWKEDL